MNGSVMDVQSMATSTALIPKNIRYQNLEDLQ